MDAEGTVRRAAAILSVIPEDAYKMISSAFETAKPEDALCDLFGYDNIELVFAIVENRKYFTNNEITNDEPKYIEHLIPAGKSIRSADEDLVAVSRTGEDAKYFAYKRFNTLQSAVFEAAYNSEGNMLVCAPTGAGKTDVALLALLRALKTRNSQVIYIVPMKALATEVTRKYERVFKGSGVGVIEYTGDTEIAASVANLARVIVCTPEKFDISTRRLSPVFSNVRLVVIDEIHLLGDDRGPVLEVLVARMFRMSELKQRIIRLVGLSATLPNYKDVGRFIRAEHVFFFGPMYRPVPLEIKITGFKKGTRASDEQEYLLRAVGKQRAARQQVLIFVTSRARTGTVAKLIAADTNVESEAEPGDEEETGVSATKAKKKVASSKLPPAYDYLFRHRVGVHHAGMARNDRLLMEEYFRSGAIDVLVSTSTLAWGVNLPAHTVIIYGTSFYNPAKGAFEDLGILDVVQIFGRAGRPQYDSRGEAVLITRANKMDSYIAMLKASQSIESRLLHHITDAMAAEIYLQTITSVATALQWIKSTFLFIRMRQSPALYGLFADPCTSTASTAMVQSRISDLHISSESSPLDEHALADYVLLSLKRLESCGLVSVARPDERDHNTWRFEATAFGPIASLHYLNHRTLHLWLSKLRACAAADTDILFLLLESYEFKSISLREDEVAHLEELHTKLLISRDLDGPFESSVEAKLTILVAAYFNYIRPSIFSLACDMDYIVDCLSRLLSALKQVLLHLKLFAFFRVVVLLERKVRREKPIEKQVCSYSATDCGDFIDLEIVTLNGQSAKTDSKSRTLGTNSLILYCDNTVVYAAEFGRRFRHYVKLASSNRRIEIHGTCGYMKETLKVSTDYSMACLYRTGIHVCDRTYKLGGVLRGCPHIIPPSLDNPQKPTQTQLSANSVRETYGLVLDIHFNLRIQFIKIEAVNQAEKLKVIDVQIHKHTGSMLVIAPGNISTTTNDLNTLVALSNNFSDLFDCRQDSHASGFIKNHRWVAGLKEAKRIAHKFDRIVFKGCYDNDAPYPIYDIMRICHGRTALIYEDGDFIEYFNSIYHMNNKLI